MVPLYLSYFCPLFVFCLSSSRLLHLQQSLLLCESKAPHTVPETERWSLRRTHSGAFQKAPYACMQKHTQRLAQHFFYGTCFAPRVTGGSQKVIKKIYVTTYCITEAQKHTLTDEDICMWTLCTTQQNYALNNSLSFLTVSSAPELSLFIHCMVMSVCPFCQDVLGHFW